MHPDSDVNGHAFEDFDSRLTSDGNVVPHVMRCEEFIQSIVGEETFPPRTMLICCRSGRRDG